MVEDLVSKSSQSWSRYMTLNGLTEHTGAAPSMLHLYIVKENLDNSCDFEENTYMDAKDRRVISLQVQKTESTLKISVRNSNQDNRPTAFQMNLRDIVNFDYFTSSKKNKFRVGRGAIGDALKPMLSIPYALNLERGDVNGIDAPLVIQYNDLESQISLDTAKFGINKLKPIINTLPRPVTSNYTQVQLTFPISKLSHDVIEEIRDYCLKYSIFSTHIKFNFDFDGAKFTTPDNAMSSSTWSNPISIWAYTYYEFNVFIENLVNQSIPISAAFSSFRELKWLPKKWKPKILGELSEQDKKDLFGEFKSNSRPLDRLRVPYGGNKVLDEIRKAALIKRISAVYDVDTLVSKYKVVHSRYRSPDGNIDFPYIFELVVIPFKDILTNTHTFIGSINNSVSIINSGKSLFDGKYVFKDKADYTIWNMDGILNRWYGHNLKDAKKSWPCVVAANLLTPKIYWREQGKSTCVIEPFSDTIIETITKVMKKIPTFHGWGLDQPTLTSEKEKKKAAIEYLVDFLLQRKKDVGANPSLLVTDRITQSSVWYRLRPHMVADMDEGKFKPNKSWTQTRRYLTSKIDDLCSGKMLYKGNKLFPGEEIVREDVGIYATAKGLMIYGGDTYPISIDNIKKLAENGVAVWAIEKEGIPDIIAPHAAEFGIALIATGGRFTKYVKKLIEEIKKIGSVVQIVVDYDAVGCDIARSTYTPTVKIGLDNDVVEWLQRNGYPTLTQADVEEKYKPPKGILIDDDYLKQHRIELDSIVAKTSGKALFKYLLHRAQLPEFSPEGFNLNKVVKRPKNDEFYPPNVISAMEKLDRYMDKLLEDLDNHIEILLEDPRKQIKYELEHASELKTICDKNYEIKERLNDVVSYDDGIKHTAAKISRLIYRLLSKIEPSRKRYPNTD
jgi:hypothetical protein